MPLQGLKGETEQPPPHSTQISMSVDIPSGLQLPETNKQKKSGVKIRLEGNVCMERPLNESPLLKRERGHFTPTLGILFLFSRLFPVPGPSPY